jgi:hypothetical protein
MQALAVVVLDVDAQDSFEMAETDDQEVVGHSVLTERTKLSA